MILRFVANRSRGGKLIMFEITEPDKLRAGFVFGLLPGWWLGNLSPRTFLSICCRKDEDADDRKASSLRENGLLASMRNSGTVRY
jgi:hypothetical protein